jgi:hypothetical protein
MANETKFWRTLANAEMPNTKKWMSKPELILNNFFCVSPLIPLR